MFARSRGHRQKVSSVYGPANPTSQGWIEPTCQPYRASSLSSHVQGTGPSGRLTHECLISDMHPSKNAALRAGNRRPPFAYTQAGVYFRDARHVFFCALRTVRYRLCGGMLPSFVPQTWILDTIVLSQVCPTANTRITLACREASLPASVHHLSVILCRLTNRAALCAPSSRIPEHCSGRKMNKISRAIRRIRGSTYPILQILRPLYKPSSPFTVDTMMTSASFEG